MDRRPTCDGTAAPGTAACRSSGRHRSARGVHAGQPLRAPRTAPCPAGRDVATGLHLHRTAAARAVPICCARSDHGGAGAHLGRDRLRRRCASASACHCRSGSPPLLPYGAALLAGNRIFVRYAIPLLPTIAILAARGIDTVATAVPRYGRLAAVGLAVVCLAGPGRDSIACVRLLARPDTRDLALQFLRDHVAPGETIVVAGHAFATNPSFSMTSGDAVLVFGAQAAAILLDRRAFDQPWLDSGYGMDGSLLDEDHIPGRWVVTSEHPALPGFGRVPARVVDILRRHGATPVATFVGFDESELGKAVFDPIDATFIPVHGCAAQSRPGPNPHRLAAPSRVALRSHAVARGAAQPRSAPGRFPHTAEARAPSGAPGASDALLDKRHGVLATGEAAGTGARHFLATDPLDVDALQAAGARRLHVIDDDAGEREARAVGWSRRPRLRSPVRRTRFAGDSSSRSRAIAWSTVACWPLSRLIVSLIDTFCVSPPPPPLPHVGTRLFSRPELADCVVQAREAGVVGRGLEESGYRDVPAIGRVEELLDRVLLNGNRQPQRLHCMPPSRGRRLTLDVGLRDADRTCDEVVERRGPPARGRRSLGGRSRSTAMNVEDAKSHTPGVMLFTTSVTTVPTSPRAPVDVVLLHHAGSHRERIRVVCRGGRPRLPWRRRPPWTAPPPRRMPTAPHRCR